MNEATELERRTYDIPTCARLIGCSRNHAYTLAREGVFPVVHLGSKRVVAPREKFDAWLAGEQQ